MKTVCVFALLAHAGSLTVRSAQDPTRPTALHAETSVEKGEKHAPIGEGAYQSAAAVMERTTSKNTDCEDGKWADCYQTEGDYLDHKKGASAAQVKSEPKGTAALHAKQSGQQKQKHAPIGEGAYQSAAAVMERTTSKNTDCEDGKWADCYQTEGDYLDHKKGASAAQVKSEPKDTAALHAKQSSQHRHAPVGEGAYQSAAAVMERTTSKNTDCEDGKWADCYQTEGDYLDHKKGASAAQVKSEPNDVAALHAQKSDQQQKHAPVGEGAYQSAAAVMERTTSKNTDCEDGKWADCYQTEGDYLDHKKGASAAQVKSVPKDSAALHAEKSDQEQNHAPIGEGAYQSAAAVMERTTSKNTDCEDGKWADCYQTEGDYLDHKKGASAAQVKSEPKDASALHAEKSGQEQKHAPVGEGAYQSAAAVMERTTSKNTDCEDGKWHDCYQTEGDYLDHKKQAAI